MSQSSFHNPEAGVIASASDIMLPTHRVREVRYNALPGIIIFVHGVNSTGEWFDAAEEGLCQGLNERLRRRDFDDPPDNPLSYLLRAAKYRSELTPDGYLTRPRSEDAIKPEEFVQGSEASPVIRFRWGYVANKDDLADVGRNILLDEDNAWGGGPFANGCSALPDLWSNGTVTDLFAGLQVQQMNTEASRLVYGCPARHYGAHAAWRLAALVAQVRERHTTECNGKECPVTIVCHSQGNMVGLASAFIGDKKFNGKGVADTYILANPPYSVLPNWMDNFAQYDQVTDLGRVTMLSRRKTLDAFFGIVKERQSNLASAACVNGLMGNDRKPWDVEQDQKEFPTHKRVFLYANPHDQVISVSTVLGMGWMGLPQAVLAGQDEDMSKAETRYVFEHAEGVLYQRIWAQGNPLKYTDKDKPFKVGAPGQDFVYYDKDNPARADVIQGAGHEFWQRKPLEMRFHLGRTWSDEQQGVAGKVGATILGGTYEIAIGLVRVLTLGKIAPYIPVNATPPDGWTVRINAHKVRNPIAPTAIHLYHPQADPAGQQPEGDGKQRPDGANSSPRGKVEGVFSQGPESHTDALNPRTPTKDVYDKYRDAGQGDEADEAALRYEHNASVRQLARRKKDNRYEEAVKQMKKDGDLSGDEYKEFRKFDQEKREDFLREVKDMNATNHSTILTNPAHSRQVLAYDVNVGMNGLPTDQMNWLRQFADWRYCDPKDPVMAKWREYYMSGCLEGDKKLEAHDYYQPEVPAQLGIDTERSNSGPWSQKHRTLPPEPHQSRELSLDEQMRRDWRAEQQRLRRPTEKDDVFGAGPNE